MTSELVRCGARHRLRRAPRGLCFRRKGGQDRRGRRLSRRARRRAKSQRTFFPADRLVVPGFINGHSHAYQILLRGWADDWPFAKWRSDALYRVVPQLTPDDVYWTFVAAFSEMLAAGITTVAEFFYLNGAGNAHAEAAIRAARDTGIRLVLARTWMDARLRAAGSFAKASTPPPNARVELMQPLIPRQTSASRRIRCTLRRTR